MTTPNEIATDKGHRRSNPLRSLWHWNRNDPAMRKIVEAKVTLDRNAKVLLKRYQVLSSCCGDERLESAIQSGIQVASDDHRYCTGILELASNLVHEGQANEALAVLDELRPTEHHLLVADQNSTHASHRTHH